MQLYKGYILTKNKESIEPIKGRRKFKTLEEVQCESEYAGVIGNDTVLVDIDDGEQSEVLMNIVEELQLNCRVIQTTRGRHFLFKNSNIKKNGNHLKLACGLIADIKIGNNQYEVLKFNGVERFIEWDVEEGVDYQEIPKWLYPVKTNVDLLNMEEGDGRNPTLFSYILTLNKYGFSKDEARECISIANKYVLKEALSDNELDTIMRDDAFPSVTFFDENKFLHNNFAEFLKNNEHIKRINGQLHVYQDGIYIEGSRQIESAMIKHIPTMTARQRVEVLKYLDIICPVNEHRSDANLIAFKNGIYDISTKELKEFSPDIIITNKIPWDYKQGAYSELADKTLNKLACNDEKIRALLEECIGYIFFQKNELSKAFILLGDKSNGKSTFLTMLKTLLGTSNYSALGLEELDERFSVATLSGVLANIGDDISDEFLKGRSIAIFKKLVSGNHVKAEIKNDPSIFFMEFTGKLIFSANEMPKMKDKTGAVLRRLVPIPFMKTFSKDDPDYDPYIIYKLKSREAMEYLICLGLVGIDRVLLNNDFTLPAAVEKQLKEIEVTNNPILSFIEQKELCEIVNQPTKDVYRLYKLFCIEEGFMEMTQSTFSKEINRRLGLTVKRVRVKGQLIGIYVKS